MFKKIVVGYDGSASSQDAVRLVALLTKTADARVTDVCVHGPARTTRINARTGEFEGTAADAERTLELLHDRVGEAVQCRSVPGLTVAHALRDVATEEDADLVVVGSTARARLSSTLAGSTADQLLQDSPRAVVVVPAGFAAGAVSKAGAAYVQDADDDAVLATAHRIAADARAWLRVITVLDSVAGTDTEPTERRDATMQRLERAAARLGGGVRVECTVLEGTPVNALRAQTAGLDLLVMGSRGFGPLRRVVLGSVSHGVLLRASCPVLVLPRGAAVIHSAAA
jgi:nucleotide-binding universal stress UspA family protein